MELFLIRHGQSVNNAKPREERVEDAELTDIGHQQCELLSSWASSLDLSEVFCSPFLRTLQTADYLTRRLELTPKVRVELHELGGCVSGVSEDTYEGRPGMTRADIRREYPRYQIAEEIDERGWWRSRPYESEEAARGRAAKLLAQTQAEFSGTQERVAFVMHADICRLIIEHVCDAEREVPNNTSITQLSLDDEGYQVAQYNRVAHLPAELLTL